MVKVYSEQGSKMEGSIKKRRRLKIKLSFHPRWAARIILGFVFSFIILWGGFYFYREYSSHLPVLKVLTYSSFISPYGPARNIQKEFEKECECRIRWVEAEDSTLMVQKLQMRPDGLGIDVLLGLDQLTLSLAFDSWEWKNLSIYNFPWINPAQYWVYSWAVPISWAPLTFVSKDANDRPSDFLSLLDKKWEKSISIPHPRSSTVGLQFYFWLYSSLKPNEISQFLRKFKSQIYNVSHSWSASYGLFQKGKASLTFSYQTSVMYHEIEENEEYFNSSFSKGHPYQVEYAVIPATCTSCPLAKEFIKFLLKPEIQKILMEKNYMLPVIQRVTQGTPFENLKKLPLISYKTVKSFLSNKDGWIEEWEEVLD